MIRLHEPRGQSIEVVGSTLVLREPLFSLRCYLGWGVAQIKGLPRRLHPATGAKAANRISDFRYSPRNGRLTQTAVPSDTLKIALSFLVFTLTRKVIP